MHWLVFLYPAVVKTAANDDLGHRTAELAPIFAKADDCIPTSNDPPITIAIDAFEDALVACAQVRTRQGATVFVDNVSYTCWNVDPKNGALTKRTDRARAYFGCQDGCPGEVAFRSGSISWDGKRIVLRGIENTVDVYERETDGSKGSLVKTFAVPKYEDVILHIGSLFFTDGGLVLDEAGKTVARLPRGPVRVVDAKRVIHVDSSRGTLFDLATKRKQLRRLEHMYGSGPIAFDGTLYAIADRKLVELNARLKKKREISLPACTARSD